MGHTMAAMTRLYSGGIPHPRFPVARSEFSGERSPDSVLSAYAQDSEWRTSTWGRTAWPNRIRWSRSSRFSARSNDRSRLAS